METANISISVTMQREWVCEQYTNWAYTARVVSNEFCEVLGTFSAGNLAKVINKAADKAQQYINDEAINIFLKCDDCGSISKNDVWCQVDNFDYAKSQRIADKLLAR